MPNPTNPGNTPPTLPRPKEAGPVAVTYLAPATHPLLTDGSDNMSTCPSSANILPSSRAQSPTSNYTHDSSSTNLGIAANPLASTLTSLATTIESMRGQDTPAAHATMGSLSSTMTALATAITSLHEQSPKSPATSSGSLPDQSKQNNSGYQNNNPYRDSYQTSGTARPDPRQFYDDYTRSSSQDSFDHPFRTASPRVPEPENPSTAALDELRAEHAKLRASIDATRQGTQQTTPRPLPSFPVPAPPSPTEKLRNAPQNAPPPKDETADRPISPASVPLATQHQAFAQSMATLLDALDTMGSDLHSARRTAIEREASFGREVTRFFHQLDDAHLTTQRVEFLCTFGKRCLLAQLANTTAGTAAIEALVGQHEAAREQATQLAERASSLVKTRTQLEAAASASADREATLALEKKRVVGEKERIAAERDRLVAQLQAVHSTAGEHDKAIANERADKDRRIAELKKDLASVTETLNSSVEVLDAIRQKGANPESWRATEKIRGQLRWARDKVQRNRNDREASLSHTMAARLALVAPQQGADTIKGRRPRTPARLPLSTVDE